MNANQVLAWFLFLFVFLSSEIITNAQSSAPWNMIEWFRERKFLERWAATELQPDSSQAPCYEKQIAGLQTSLRLQNSYLNWFARAEEQADYKIPEPNLQILAEKQALRNAIQKYQEALEVVLRLRLASIRIEGTHLIVEANGCAQTFLFQRSIDLAKWETLSEHTIKESDLKIPLDKSSKAAFYRIVPIVQDND